MMVSRSGARMTETRSDVYGYNDRSELTNAVKNATLNEYAYQYDDIGNRLASLDLGDSRVYQANSLNQYTSISNAASTAEAFIPQYDLDGNQTLVRTTTGDWSVTYNGENRPVSWSCGATNITMKFDRMGRRVEYLETESAEESVISDGITNIVVTVTTNAHHRFVYDGYLCIQRLNALSNNAVDLAFGWDPSEPVATRPLWMQRVSGTYNFFYFHDGNKNVSELVSYQSARGVPAHYEYAPFGTLTAATTNTAFTAFNVAEANPFRFSSEYDDDALGLVYYNYRHYDPVMGRWLSRDPNDAGVSALSFGYNYIINQVLDLFDYLGLMGRGGPVMRNPRPPLRPRPQPNPSSKHLPQSSRTGNKPNPGNRKSGPPIPAPNTAPVYDPVKPTNETDTLNAEAEAAQDIAKGIEEDEIRDVVPAAGEYDFIYTDLSVAIYAGYLECWNQARAKNSGLSGSSIVLPLQAQPVTLSVAPQKCRCCKIMIVSVSWGNTERGGDLYALGAATFYEKACENVYESSIYPSHPGERYLHFKKDM